MIPEVPAGPMAILTRPARQSAWLAARLQQAGWTVCDWPALRLHTRETGVIPDPAEFDLVMFVSGNAVRHFHEQRRRLGLPEWPGQVPVAVVGPASAEAAADLGRNITVWQPPESDGHFDSEALWATLLRAQFRPERVLIVRGGAAGQPEGQGRTWLAERWQAQGARVCLHSAYERVPAAWPESRWHRLAEAVAQERRLHWLFTSAEGLEAVASQRGAADLAACWRGQRVIATHPRVAAAVLDCARRGGLATDAGQCGQPVQCHPDLVIQVSVPHDPAVLAAFVN